MRMALLALLLVAGASVIPASAAYADDLDVETTGILTHNSWQMRQAPRGQALGTSAIVYDSTWIGYSATHAPGPNNYWNIWASSVYRPGTHDPANVGWDFEDFSRCHGDSLMGWCPTNDRMSVRGVSLTDDRNYVYACMDFGNETSYKIPGTNQRTWGVIGAWHSDPGVHAGIGVTWVPMSGSRSAWCGLRQHHDMSVIDAQTNNPYNSDCADFIVQNRGMTVKNFPGYVRAWDQMLYRDFTPVEGQDLTVSFLYRTFMSTAFTVGVGRCGWFHGDPLSTTAGNFISSFTQNGPIDSFSVYIGVPVDDDAVTLSTGAVAPVFDTQRRWFSEVLRIWDGPTAPYYELLGKTGKNPVMVDTTGNDTTAFNSFSAVVPWSVVTTIVHSPLNTHAGNIRLVFRVKTNNTGDDLTSSTWRELGGRGAAQVDDVTIRWGVGPGSVIGDFEGAEGTAGNVNNAIGASPVTYWKATGRPPALYFHARSLAGLPWNDICGPVDGGARKCTMKGNVLDAGNDPSEMIGDNSYEAGRNGSYGCLSPTIDLSTATSPNSQGLTSAQALGSDDYYIGFDVYTADFSLDKGTGVGYYLGCSSYPNVSPGNKTEIWGDVATSPFDRILSPQCLAEKWGLRANNLIYTSAVSGKPDSIRIWLGIYNFPLRWGVNLGAQPTDGAYFDNVSLLIVNKTGDVDRIGQITAFGADSWFADAFPASRTVTLGPGTFASSLDTCGALVKGPFNKAPATGLLGNRLDILADSIVVDAADLTVADGDTNSLNVRVDLVFRILPGPGNYRANPGDVAPKYPPVAGMALLRRPDIRNASATCLVSASNPADSSFWAAYIRNPGEHSSPSPHPGGQWGHLTWNSARIDTTEVNFFGAVVRLPSWRSTLHEEDPHYGLLGISRPRCFIIDTTLFSDFSSPNIVCGSAPAWLSPEIPEVTPPRSRTGWDGTVTTIEGTKVIPDGLLTPGSHVQYFFRKSQIFGYQGYALLPDTATIFPNDTGDGHRWQQFSVLPDRWKDPRFGGSGMACMLYLDYDDGRGTEMVWCSVMDSLLGGTAANKWGAHNGWHAAGDGKSLDKNTNPTLQADAFVYRNAQPGTSWDMYGIREPDFQVGTRLGGRFATKGTGLLTDHDADVAPTPLMLKQFYSSLVLLGSGGLGPAMDMPEDDIRILTDFLNDDGGLIGKPRSLFVAGSHFVATESVDPVHAAFLANQLGVSLVSTSYTSLASNTSGCADLTSTAVISSGDVFGVGLSCSSTTDVLEYNPLKSGAQNVSFYQNTGAAGPYAAAVYHAPEALNPEENYASLVDGFDLGNLWGRYCATSKGRIAYVLDLSTKLFGSVCSAWAQPGGGVDVPQTAAGIADYMKIGNSATRSGNATVSFGVATTGRVRVRLYDVSGRLVRTLADRTFPGGQSQTVKWDGRDNRGNQAARGVYFARIDYASGDAINGRLVVLQ